MKKLLALKLMESNQKMSYKSKNFNVNFFANKVHAHRWPLKSPIWSESVKKSIDLDLNQNREKKEIMINDFQIRIDNYDFEKIQKVGVTVPLFKKETRMVFEGHFLGYDAHVHITINSNDYLDIFNKLMDWKNNFFPD